MSRVPSREISRRHLPTARLPVPFAFVSLLALLPACSLDDRSLSLARPHAVDAGTPRKAGEPLPGADAAHTDTSRSESFLDGGDSGDGAPAKSDAAPASDADVIVVEAVFDRDTESWEGDPGVTLLWQDEDASGAASSGSASLSNDTVGDGATWVFGTANRCAPALGNTVYVLSGSAFIPSGQGAGGAGLGLMFFSEPACAGASQATYDAPPTDKSGSWTPLSGETTSPQGAKSLRVRLIVPKPLAEPSIEANFDDVRVIQR